MKNLIFWSAILGVLLFAGASTIGGFHIDGYSRLSQYISESYATGMPYANYFQYAYMASGVLIALFAFMAPSALPKSKVVKTAFLAFGILYGLGTVVTGLFPCDIGCVLDADAPSLSQFIHNTAGTFTYMFVPFCIIGAGMILRKWPETKKLSRVSLVCGILALVFVVLLFGDATGPLRGLFQRFIESSILFWIVYVAFYIRNSKI